jgi:hypothetical protein
MRHKITATAISLVTAALLAALLAWPSLLSAQSVVGGQTAIGGQTTISGLSGPTPPPPGPSILPRMFGGIFNSSTPSWPPRDLAGAAMQQGTCRIWDSGAKIGQLMTVSGPVGAHTYSFNWTALDSIVQRCKQTAGFTGAPNAPMKVIYTLGDTPAGAALAGTISVGSCGGVAGCCSPDVTNSCRAYDDNTQGGSTETDTTMFTFLSNLITHLNSLGITLDAIELQNEWDTQGFQCWNGAGCGGGTSPLSSNNTTALMNKAMVRRGADLRAFLNCKSPSTVIYSPSSHVLTVQPGNILDNFIATSVTTPTLVGGTNGYPAGCPTVASATVFGWQVIDVLNIHPDGNPDTPESFIATNGWLVCELTAGCVSQSGASHNGTFFTHLIPMPKTADEFGTKSAMCSTGDCLEADATRRYLYCAFLGYQDCDWYQMDGKGSFTALVGTLGGNGFDRLALWMIGGVPGTFANPAGTVYTEPFTSSGGSPELFVYDSSATDSNSGYTCPNTIGGAGCTTVTVPAGYTTYESLDGVQHAVNGSHQIAVGGKPVCVSTGPC